MCQVTEVEAMEATWIITTVILITTAGGPRLAQERRGARGVNPPDRKELIEALRTKFTMKPQCRVAVWLSI